ncbi:ABC transporter permease [Chryseolinea sp. T2]|uniref:ABC transporter permease n=1 Tax=Chryseolinea sp. T2 TaxID=3129255 RepID=UPI0030770547
MSLNTPGPQPPRWLDRLITKYCPPHLLEEVLGDLHERYSMRVQRDGEPKARRQYSWEVLRYLRTVVFQRQPSPFTQPALTDMLRNNFKIARRSLYRNKTYSLINVTGLGLGLACAILIFAIVKHHLSFDTFHTKKDRIYRITTEFHQDGVTVEANVPQPMGKAFSNDYTFAEKVAMVFSDDETLVSIPSSEDNRRFEEHVAYAEGAFFDIMDFPLVEGSKDSLLAQPNTAIITQRVARKFFGEENPINQVVRVSNKWDYKVVGVLKDMPVNTDRTDEIYLSYRNLKDYSNWLAGDSWTGLAGGMNCFILLKPNITASDVDKVFPALSEKYYDERDAKMFQFKLQHLSDFHFNTEMGGYISKGNLWALALIGLFLIVTACVNFTNLATAQALKRSKEIGVRKVLGSQRSQVFWQFMTETITITAMALVTGYAIAQLAIPYVISLLKLPPGFDNILQDTELLIFLPVLLLVVTFFAGFYPALVLAGFQPVLALKGKLSQKHTGGFTMRRGLVVGQFAISQLLIIGTIVIASQMRYARQADMGFTKDAIVMFPVPERETAVINSLRNELSRIAGIEAVTFCSRAPASVNWASVSFGFDSRPEKETFDIVVKAADDQYVPTFNLQVIAGRNIDHSDTVRDFLINETAVTKLGLKTPDDALGKKIEIGLNNRKGIVVGVVKDFHNQSFHEAIEPLCIVSSNEWYSDFAVKLNAARLPSSIEAIGDLWKRTFPEQVYEYEFLDDQIGRFYEMDSMILRLIQVSAAIAIFICCLGLYGLVSFMAAQKTKEVGVRKVLGASAQSILWLFGREFTRLIIVAFMLAAPLAWWLMNNWLANFQYRIEIGTEIFATAIVTTFAVAMITVGYQTIKAALANPVDSLRNE